MPIAFDPDKDAENRRKHGMSLADANRFDWDNAVIDEDRSEAYGEARFRALSFVGLTLCVLIFTTNDDAQEDRAISLRKATKPEEREWDEQ